MVVINISEKQVYYLGFSAIGLSILQQIIYFSYGFIVYFGFAADIIITICALYIRFRLINIEATTKYVKETDDINKSIRNDLKPSRFLNLMCFAMIIGTVASIAIHYNFIIGIICYFIMQMIHIYAFSGILHFNPKLVFFSKSPGSIKRSAIILTLGFVVIMPILYFFMIVPTWGIFSLLILPYVLVLIIMTLITYWHLGYTQRPIKFRLMLCLGASLFLFSDLMIGYSVFNPFFLAPLFIYPTWILAMFFMQFSVMELKSKLS